MTPEEEKRINEMSHEEFFGMLANKFKHLSKKEREEKGIWIGDGKQDDQRKGEENGN